MSATTPDPESVQAARDAGLSYTSDAVPGIRRLPAGDGFEYFGPDGEEIADEETLARIRSLAIPPAWTDVWISPKPRGHIQATGRDARGRKQYRYHPRWREVRDSNKFDRMVDFAKALPLIRRRVDRDLKRPGLPRAKVLAAIVRLLEVTLVRIGNEEYARQNGSFGLTTLRGRHARVKGSRVQLFFKGKHGKEHSVGFTDRRLAAVVRRCQELPGQHLFQYVDEDGVRRSVDSDDVNEYLRSVSGKDFTAKDFRTWSATVLAARALEEMERVDSEAQAKRNVLAAIERVAKRLGNTRTVCRKCYVHPAIVESYMEGGMADLLKRRAESEMRTSLHRLGPEEAAVLALLQQRLKREARSGRKRAA
jgi:DNA topoisomerase I